MLGPTWAYLGHLRALLGPSWAYLGPCWAQLGPILGILGRSLGLSWAMLGLSSGIFRSLKANRSCARMPRVCFRASSWNHSFCRHYPRRLSLTRPGGMREAIESAAPCRRQAGTGVLNHLRLLQTPLLRRLRLLPGHAIPPTRTLNARVYPLY